MGNNQQNLSLWRAHDLRSNTDCPVIVIKHTQAAEISASEAAAEGCCYGTIIGAARPGTSDSLMAGGGSASRTTLRNICVII